MNVRGRKGAVCFRGGLVARRAAAAIFLCALAAWGLRLAAGACRKECIETNMVCRGAWMTDPLYGPGWSVLIEEYVPPVAGILWAPDSWTATPDNYDSGKKFVCYQFVPEGQGWPCQCAAPTPTWGGETPSAGGPDWTGALEVDDDYYQYCNHCLPPPT